MLFSRRFMVLGFMVTLSVLYDDDDDFIFIEWGYDYYSFFPYKYSVISSFFSFLNFSHSATYKIVSNCGFTLDFSID